MLIMHGEKEKAHSKQIESLPQTHGLFPGRFAKETEVEIRKHDLSLGEWS
jgi:hypothetical protein